MERKHCHILQVARALKFHAQLPTQFWGECAITVVHIITQLPSPILSFKTPFEFLYSKPPSYSHLHAFGCLAYATNVHISLKFDYRAMPSIFIGYPVVQKAYKLFDLSIKKVFTSRDVKFHEDIFPYASLKSNSSLSSLTHNYGPIPLVTHDIPSPLNSFPDSNSPAHSSFFPDQPNPPHPTIETADLPSSSRPFELAPSSPVPTLAAPSILRTYTRHPKPFSLPNDPSSQIDLNPPPSPSTPPVSPSPAPSFPPILSAPPAETPLPSLETYSPKPTPPLRRSNHHITPSVKLNDYVCSHVFSDQLSSLIPGPPKGTRYPLANYVSYHRYKPAYRSFVAKLSVVT